MAGENPTYESVLRENEDLLLRNSELQLQNRILSERAGSGEKRASCPPGCPKNGENPPCPDDEEQEDDLGAKINVEVDFSQGAKIVKIKTDREKLMYTVSFLANLDGTFLVKVWKFGNLEFPAEIFRAGYDSSRKEEAIGKFRVLIVDYTNLVKAETDKPDPRKIFDDCVNYRITDPDCCRNCSFCLKDEDPRKKGIKPRKTRYVCTNRKNVAQYEKILRNYDKTFFAAQQPYSDGQPPDREYFSPEGKKEFDFSGLPLQAYPFDQPYPPFCPPVQIDVKVVVEPRALCDGYRRGEGAPVPQRYEDLGSFEFDKDLMVIIGNMVDDKIGKVVQEDVVVYCGGAEETQGRP